jgi:ferrous iron transport protein B
MRFVLIGQPNCGKSTLFNQVAGYKAETGNFAGTTVTFTETKVRILGDVVELVDLPGTYTLLGTNPAERVVLDYLIDKPVDAIINVIDATHMIQGLTLTLELMELGRPIVLVINMMDEAKRQGLKIDGEQLEKLLGMPVMPIIATRGLGIREAFNKAWHIAREKQIPTAPSYSEDIEKSILSLKNEFAEGEFTVSRRAIVVKLLEGDPGLTERATKSVPDIVDMIQKQLDVLCHHSSRQAVWMIASERQRVARELTAKVTKQEKLHLTLRDRLDDYLLHPFWGYVFLVIILGLFFYGCMVSGTC